MATLNLVLDTRRARKDGTYPLVFRIRLDKKFSDVATGFTLNKQDFDLKTSTVLNDSLANEQLEQLKFHYLKRLRAYIVEHIGNEDLKEIRNYLVNKLPNEITIMEFWKEHIETLTTAGRNGGARVYSHSLSVLSQELDLNIPFHKLNYRDILTLESNLFKRGMCANGMGVYLRSFRALCNKAINFDIIGFEWYPFRKYKIRRDKTTPRVISIAEMKSYFNIELSPTHLLYKSWLIGKLIFLLRGINIKDLLLLSSENIKADRIIYKRAKTGKIYSIKLLDETKLILEQFKPNKTLLGILTDMDLKNPVKLVDIIIQKRKVVNSHLKKLGTLIESKEPISTYVFRYSYANIAKQLGFSKDLIAEALGHQYGNSVTGIYLELFDYKIIDEMNKEIFESVC